MARRMSSSFQALGGSTSSMFSGSSQARMMVQRVNSKIGQSAQHGDGAHEAQLSIAQFNGAPKASRQSAGAAKGKSPSITNSRAIAVISSDTVMTYLPPAVRGFFMYLKKSELGSSTMRSLLF